MLHWCLWQKHIFLQSETCKSLKIKLLLIISTTSVRNMVKENVYWKFREWEELSISKSADRDPVHGKAVQVQSDQLLQMYSRFIHFSVRLGRGPVIPLVRFHLLDRKPELFRQKSIKRKPEPSKLANQQLNRLWRTIGRMLVCWKEGFLVDTSRFSRGDVMCDAHQKLPSEAHLEHSALEVGDYCSLPPGDDESRALGLCVSFKKTRRLFGVVIATVGAKSFPPRCRCERETSKEPKTIRPALCSFVFFSSD